MAPQELYDQVDELKATVQSRDEVLMVLQPADLWDFPISFVVNKDLEVVLMLHIPVAKRASFQYLYKYEPTPLSASGFEHHLLVYPKDTILAIGRINHAAHPVSEEELSKCTRIGQGPRYCPGRKFVVNQPQVGCLRALYGNDVPAITKRCPIVYMTPEIFHVLSRINSNILLLTPKSPMMGTRQRQT